MAPASTRRLPPLVCAGVLLLLLSVGAWWQVPFAHAAGNDVTVHADRYDPAEITIQGNETVTWTWAADGGSVTSVDGVFDSHPDCHVGFGPDCGQQGDTFAWTFEDVEETTTYRYASKGSFESVTGRVVVEPAPEPDPTSEPGTPRRPEPTSEPEPSPTETSEPEPSPTETEEPEPEPEPSPTGDPEPDPDPPPPPPPPPADTGPRTVAPQPVERDTVDPAPTAGAPTVADEASPSPVPDPTFEEFPEADDPSDGTDALGEVAIGGSDDGDDSNRTVWALIGGASVLGTLGAFGRTLLASDAWNA